MVWFSRVTCLSIMINILLACHHSEQKSPEPNFKSSPSNKEKPTVTSQLQNDQLLIRSISGQVEYIVDFQSEMEGQHSPAKQIVPSLQNKALIDSPSYHTAYRRMETHYRKSEYQLALTQIKQLLDSYPNSSILHHIKGLLYFRSGEWVQAEKSWKQATKLNPGNERAKLGLLQLRERRKLKSLNNQNEPAAKSTYQRG